MRTVTLGTLGDLPVSAPTAAQTVSAGPSAEMRALDEIAHVARHSLEVANAVPMPVLLGATVAAQLDAAKASLTDTIANPVHHDLALPKLAEVRATATAVQQLYNTAVTRRMFFFGGLAVVGVGGYLYFRKR